MTFIKKYQSFLILSVILLLAATLRIYNLASVPLSPDWDELSHGYNAYSIMLTGKDEYGAWFPVVLKSFGDYKPALYTYLIIPCIKLFGLTVFAVRFPSAVVGVIAVLLTYFLVKELFKKEKLALLSAFFLAISPWHIQFTHVAFEASVGMALVVAMVLFFLKGLKKPWMLSLSSLFTALAIYAYQSEKVFTPLLFLALVAVYSRQLLKIAKKHLINAVVVGLVVSLPMIIFLFANRAALSRLQSVNSLSITNPVQQQNLKQSSNELLIDKQQHDYLGEIVDNRRYEYIKTVVNGYISHFNVNWLFLEGDQIFRHQPPEMGHLYLWDLPFLLIGLYTLLFGPFEKKTKWLLGAWLLITPIPPSITTEVPHAIRTIHFLPVLQICIALGLLTFITWISEKNVYPKIGSKIIIVVVFIGLLFNVFYYLDQYYVQYNYFSSESWQYESQQAAYYVRKNHNNYKKVIINNKITYIYFLFYMKYPPSSELYQEGIHSNYFTFSNLEFNFPAQLQEDLHLKGDLLVGLPGDFPDDGNIIKKVYYLDGQPALEIYKP